MSQTLMVRFGADTSAAQRAVVEMATTVMTSAVSMGTALRGSAENVEMMSNVMSKLPTIARAAVGGFLAFEAVKFSLSAVNKQIEEAEKQLGKLVEIGAKASSAGVGTTFLQGWLGQAKSLNTEASTLEGMLTRAREASTIRQGTGDDRPVSAMTERLQRQAKAGNVSAADVAGFQGQDSQEGRIRAVLDLVQRLMAEGKQLAALDLANAMFGGAFEDKLRSGVDMVGQMRRALDGLTATGEGRIIPQSEIEAARQITARLEEAKTIMADAMRPLTEDIARNSQAAAMSMADFKVNVATAVSYLMEVYKWVSSIGDRITALGNSQFFKNVADYLDKNGWIDNNVVKPIDKPPAAPPENSPLAVKIAPKTDTTRNFVPDTRAKKSGGSESDPIEDFIKGIEKSTAALKVEVETCDKSNAVKRVAIELAKAEAIAKEEGKTLTEQQVSRIRAAASATSEYKDKLADLAQQQRQAAEATKYFGDAAADALGDALFNATSLTDIFRNLSSSVGRSALTAIMTGSGPLAGFLGTAPAASQPNSVGGLAGMVKAGLPSLFGGFRANGGGVQAGGVYRVNELGQEFFAPGVDGSIIPAGRGGGLDPAPSINFIDQRPIGSPDIAPTTRRNAGGGTDVILRQAENGLANRGRRGQGPLAPFLNTAAERVG